MRGDGWHEEHYKSSYQEETSPLQERAVQRRHKTLADPEKKVCLHMREENFKTSLLEQNPFSLKIIHLNHILCNLYKVTS